MVPSRIPNRCLSFIRPSRSILHPNPFRLVPWDSDLCGQHQLLCLLVSGSGQWKGLLQGGRESEVGNVCPLILSCSPFPVVLSRFQQFLPFLVFPNPMWNSFPWLPTAGSCTISDWFLCPYLCRCSSINLIYSVGNALSYWDLTPFFSFSKSG